MAQPADHGAVPDGGGRFARLPGPIRRAPAAGAGASSRPWCARGPARIAPLLQGACSSACFPGRGRREDRRHVRERLVRGFGAIFFTTVEALGRAREKPMSGARPHCGESVSRWRDGYSHPAAPGKRILASHRSPRRGMMRWERRRGGASIAALGGSQVQVPGLTMSRCSDGGMSIPIRLHPAAGGNLPLPVPGLMGMGERTAGKTPVFIASAY